MAYALGNMVDFIRGFHERAVQHQVDQAETNYLNDPEGTIKSVMQISPSQGMSLQDRYTTQQQNTATAQAATDKAAQDKVKLGLSFLHGLPQGTDPIAAIEAQRTALTNQGFKDNDIAGLKALVQANPNIVASSDDAVWKAQNSDHVAGPGSVFFHGSTPTYQVGTPDKSMVVGSDKAGRQVIQTPGISGGPIPQPGAAPAAPVAGASDASPSAIQTTDIPPGNGTPLTMGGVDPFAHNLKMEGGTNPDGSGRTSPKGAQGAGQIMPGTGPEAAAAAGLPWDPQRNLNDPAYSAALGRAYHAVQIGRFGGDLQKADAAYNAGPGRVMRATTQGAKWLAALPAETQNYVRQAAPGFYGGAAPSGPVPAGGGSGSGARVLFSQPAVATPQFRSATPDELKDYPEGTAAQVGPDGKLVNIKTPPAGAKPKGDPVTTTSNAIRSLRELDDTLSQIQNDADVKNGWSTGTYGAIMSHVPGTGAKRLKGLVDTAHGQALNSAVQALKEAGNGNLGFRMTQAEAQAEGASLAGALSNTDQSSGDYLASITAGRQRIEKHIADMENGAIRAGVAARLPNGTLLMKGDQYKGHTYLGGDASQPTSWKN